MKKILLFLIFPVIHIYFYQRSNSQTVANKASVNLQIDVTKKFQQTRFCIIRLHQTKS
jgi:hypothetical protein